MTRRDDDPAARALIQQMAQAHRALPGMSCRFTVTAALPSRTATTMEGSFALARPGRARLEAGAKGTIYLVAVSDGVSLTVANPPVRKFWRIPVADTGSAIYHTLASPGAFDHLIPSLAAGRTAYGGDIQKVMFQADEEVGGVACQGITLTSGAAAGVPIAVTLAIGKSDRLLRRHSVRESEFPNTVTTLTFTEVRTELPPATAFTLPTTGYAQVPAQIDWSPTLLPGTPPPPLMGTDLSGKGIDLDAMRGKVVVVHFWGTIAPRSLWGLPDLVAARKALAGRKDVAFVGVTINARSQAAEVRAALKAHGVTWPILFDGLGWETAAAKLWKIDALPFVAVIGRDGKLCAIDPGGADIEKEVRRALAGR